MNTEEFEKAVGIKISTIKKYESDFNLTIPRNDHGNRRYTETEVQIYLDLKKELATKTVSEIQKERGIISGNISVNNTNMSPNISENISNISQDNTNISVENELAIEKIATRFDTNISEVKSMIESQNNNFVILQEQSNKLSQISYQLGSLEAQLKAEKQAHESTILKYEKEKMLISDYANNSRDDLKSQLKYSKDEIEKLRAELQKEKSKTVFQKVFSKKEA